MLFITNMALFTQSQLSSYLQPHLSFSVLLSTRVKIRSFVEDTACHLVSCPQVVTHVFLCTCPTANLLTTHFPAVCCESHGSRSVCGWMAYAGTTCSTQQPSKHSKTDLVCHDVFFDLGVPDGLPKYFHLRFFHCLIHSYTALAAIQELIWTPSVDVAIRAVTKVVILLLVLQLLQGLQHRCCRSLSFGLCGQLLIPNIFSIPVIFFRFHQQTAEYFVLYKHLRYGTGSLLHCNFFHLLKGLLLFNFDLCMDHSSSLVTLLSFGDN